MSKSISELFSRNGEVTKLPNNTNDFNEVHTNKIVNRPDDKGNKAYHVYNDSGIRTVLEGGSEIADELLGNDTVSTVVKLIGNTLSQYKNIKNDPTIALSVVNNALSGSSNSTLSTIGSIAGIADSIVDIPKSIKNDPKVILSWAVSFLKSALNSTKATTDYTYITNKIQSNDDSGVPFIKNLAGSITEDMKYEFDKNRQSPMLPLTDLNDSRDLFYKNSSVSSSTNNSGSSVWNSLKNTVYKYLSNSVSSDSSSSSITTEARNILYNKMDLTKSGEVGTRIVEDYLTFIDPYGTSISTGNCKNIGEAMQTLSDAGYLSGYHDYAGFEIGNDNQWFIQIFPYPHEYTDIVHYKTLGRGSCTPGLPYYYLPNLWADDDYIVSSNRDYKGSSDHKGTERQFVTSYKRVMAKSGFSGSEISAAQEVMVHGKLFSYSYNPPILNYDLNLGTVKTEQLKLFNGSVSEVFAGMNYNSTLNLSILDDVYGNMTKYMQHYINCVYNIHEHGLAPYYECAFQINLTVLMSGGNIKYTYRFVCVPIEYTPRLSGSSESNESRIDITFGIIGFLPFYSTGNQKAIQISSKVPSGTYDDDPYHIGDKNYKHTPLSELTWNDITLRQS